MDMLAYRQDRLRSRWAGCLVGKIVGDTFGGGGHHSGGSLSGRLTNSEGCCEDWTAAGSAGIWVTLGASFRFLVDGSMDKSDE